MFTITNGKNYIGKKNNATNLSAAVTFQNKEEAETFLNNMPRAFKNLGYHIQEMKVERSGDVELVSNKEITIPECDFEQVAIETISKFYELMKNSTEMRKNFVAMKDEAELEILDIEHAIELSPNLSCPKGYKLYKLLKNARIKRRHAKDGIMILDIINEGGFNGLVNGKTLTRIKGMDGRTYAPRILKEIFE